MAASIAPARPAAHLMSLEKLRPSPAKANLTAHENRPLVGQAPSRAIAVVGLTLKEAAAVLDLDPAQVSRMVAGLETVQMHRIWGTSLHGPFAIELASAAAGVCVETTVTIRRTA